MEKILVFTAGDQPTTEEAALIQEFNDANRDVQVRSAVRLPLYGEKLEDCDGVAGAIPDEYSELPVVTPGGGGGAGIGTVILGYGPALDGQATEFVLEESIAPETYPFFAKISPSNLATRALVSQGQGLDVKWNGVAQVGLGAFVQIADGAVVTADIDDTTKVIIANGQVLTISGTTYTFTVAGGVVTTIIVGGV